MRRRPFLIVVGALALIVVIVVGWYLASPLIIDQTIDEELPFELPGQSEMEEMSESELQALGTEVMGTAAAMPSKPMEEEMPTAEEPKPHRSGSFVGADSFHQGSGTATIFEFPDGGLLLRLEDFMVTNGPDLHVLLATGLAPTMRNDLGEYVDLGPLKGNIGNQNYQVPDDLDLNAYQSVVIYCVPFHVVFATAGLTE